MVNSEDNMTNLKDTKTKFNVGEGKLLLEQKVVTGMAGRNITKNTSCEVNKYVLNTMPTRKHVYHDGSTKTIFPTDIRRQDINT